MNSNSLRFTDDLVFLSDSEENTKNVSETSQRESEGRSKDESGENEGSVLYINR